MTETFTSHNSTTINGFEMTTYENIENEGLDTETFYNSIRIDLDMIERAPRPATIQNILKHSQNLR